MQIFKLSYFVFFSCFKGQIISLNFYFKDWHLWRISPSNHLTLRFVLEFHFIKPDPLTAKGEILWEWQCLPNGFCVRFCVPCSPKWAFLSQSAVKLTFWRLCGSSQRQDAFRLPNCLLNEIVVIFPVILCCICRRLVSGLGDGYSSGNWHGEHVICALQLNLCLTRPVIYLNTMESIFCLFLLKIPLVFKEF